MNNKKKIFTAAVAICLVAILSCGTLAYFQSTKSITNKFYTASYDPENPPTADELFSIKVYETAADGSEDTDGLEYTDVLPGQELAKDPTVENTGRYAAYVRLQVTVTNANAWEAVFNKYNLELSDLFGSLNTKWEMKEQSADTTNDTVTYVFYLNEELAAGEKSTLFETVNIPAELNVEEMTELAYFEVQITGDAIQVENTGANAFDAFTNYWED